MRRMVRADVITLIADNPGAHGVFDSPETSERTVYCTVRSVGMQEMYTAMSQGLRPQYVFDLQHDFEYQGEQRLRYHDVEYRVIRTYVNQSDGIEITVERSNADV